MKLPARQPKPPKAAKEPKVKREKKPKMPKTQGKLKALKEAGAEKFKSLKGTKTIKEDRKEKEPGNRKPSKLFGLQNKIFICFIVPIVFMIAVGFISYYYSAEGLSEKFKEASG